MRYRYERRTEIVPSRLAVDPDLDAFDRLAQGVLDEGAYALRFLERLDAGSREQVARLLERGLLGRSPVGAYRVTDTGLRRLEEQALRELLADGQVGQAGRHEPRAGPSHGTPDAAQTRPYREGDPLAHVDHGETLRRARQRQGGSLPIRLTADDLVVQEAEANTRCHTVLLLDRSGSMGLYGKFLFAKRLALGLRAMIRRRFPEDRLTVAGFGTRAAVLSESGLLLASPFSVGLLDNRVALRVQRDAPDVPEHFTNLQAGLRLARHLLRGKVGENRQILCLTDGEPTAHEDAGELVLAYPPTRATAEATVREVVRCRQAGIGLSFFALIDSPLIGQLHAFVERLAHVGRGAAAYCTVGTSARLVLERFRAGRLDRRHLG